MNRSVLEEAKEWMEFADLAALDKAFEWADSNGIYPLPIAYPFTPTAEQMAEEASASGESPR